jgi:hypothetical protein
MRFLSFILASMLVCSASLAQNTSVNDFYNSMKGEFSGQSTSEDHRPLYAVVLGAAAIGLAALAVRHWSVRPAPKPGVKAPPKSQKKLMAEAAKLAGVSKSHMKQLESLAKAEGLSSPLVAIICPSVLKKMSQDARTEHQKHAITALARQMTKK